MSRENTEPSVGSRIGRLTIGPVIKDVVYHKWYSNTPKSYFHYGRLVEVMCDCGKGLLVPMKYLTAERVKSCGCLRAEIIGKNKSKNLAKRILKREKIFIDLEIEQVETRLRCLQLPSITMRDNQTIEELKIKLKELNDKKDLLNLKSIVDKYLT